MDGIKEKLFKVLRLENLVDSLSGYVETRLELFKLEIREDTAKVLSKALVYLAVALTGFLFLVFFSIGLAQFLNRYFVDEFAGYWIVGGIYGVAFFLILLFRKELDHRFEKHFLSVIKRKK